MEHQPKTQQVDWPQLVRQLNDEFAALCPEERQWLQAKVSVVGTIQRDLDRLFQKAGGLKACADCDGECCGCGRHHLTLINVVAYLIEGDVPPAPDFGCTCPFLGPTGCLLPVERRPYNCITFFCETLEGQLDESGREELKALDRSLREEYEMVERRYVLGTLRGMWIGLERIADRPLLQRADKDMVE